MLQAGRVMSRENNTIYESRAAHDRAQRAKRFGGGSRGGSRGGAATPSAAGRGRGERTAPAARGAPDAALFSPPFPELVKSPIETSGEVCCQKIEGDNSCLFRAVSTAVGDVRPPADLRHGAIRDFSYIVPQECWDAEETTREKYVELACEPNFWGGEIELQILSRYYGVQICAVQLADAPDMIPYPAEPLPGNKRVYVLYDGKHYDCVMPKEIPEGYAGVFESSDKETEERVLEMRSALKVIMQSPVSMADL